MFLEPINESKKDGCKGFFKGSIVGLVGLATKPVTGILDATSKTAEGFKTIAIKADELPNEKRERFPRVFLWT